MARSKTSIVKKILLPLLLVMTLQTAVLYGTIVFGGAIHQLRQNSFDIFSEKVSSRKSSLQNDMIQRWSNVTETATSLQELAEQVLTENRLSPTDLTADSKATVALLQEASEKLLFLLRKNSVTGVFLILDGDKGDQKSGLYFQDTDPNTTPGDYSDILVRRGPSSVTKGLGIPLDSNWQPGFPLSDSCDYYQKPYNAGISYPDVAQTDLGYWCPPFILDSQTRNDGRPIITYSIPLRLANGDSLGVLGIELSCEYLQKQLPSKELDERAMGGYVLAVGSPSFADTPCKVAIKSGAILSQLFSGTNHFGLDITRDSEEFYEVIVPSTNKVIYGFAEPLRLYNTHTPFENEQWMLVGVIPKQTLMQFPNHINALIAICWVIALVIGIVGIYLATRMVTRPIGLLARQLRNTDPNGPIHLDELNITEIDELSDSIQELSREVADSSRKLSTILQLAGISIGAFEYTKMGKKRVFCTDQLFPMLGITDAPENACLELEQFRKIMEPMKIRIDSPLENDSNVIIHLEKEGTPEWVRLKLFQDESRVLGVFTDVTQEVLERKKLEYDRDYDLLTNVYNRRAFHNEMSRLFSEPARLKIAALVMLDLDNLKFINDTYGHDYGDEYIRSTADSLRRQLDKNSVLSRLSGDEFVFFLYGYDSKESLRAAYKRIEVGLSESFVYLPDRSRMQIRASAGVSWYPEDSLLSDDLIRYADFAMYIVKRSDKGKFNEFDSELYEREAYLLHCREELNTILEKSLVDYHFQPILDARTGEIYAYEALMRPRTENIKNPLELLSLARSQSKLSHLERITFFRAMACFLLQKAAKSNCRIFINSISNQVMNTDEISDFEKLYAPYLSRIVVELTEEERPTDEITRLKRKIVGGWGGKIALDDFGVGYNGESVLLDLEPDFVKLDISIIHNVHVDQKRLLLLETLIAYLKGRDIRIIAEGVELQEEMRVLIRLGVDYLQGYYLARPAPETAGTSEGSLNTIREEAEIRRASLAKG